MDNVVMESFISHCDEMMIAEESYIKNEKDLYWNKEKFDSGRINLCFVTGHSGSGKSTFGKELSGEKNIEHYELDDLMCIKDHFSLKELKEYGDLIYTFFTGKGKKYYKTKEDIKTIPGSDYEDKLYIDFVKYSMDYAKSHKDKKFVIEGVWIFCNSEDGKPYFNPEEFKDYAFCIKGTSMIISKIRAAKRDAYDDGSIPVKRRINFLNRAFTKNWKWYLIDEGRINRFRKYFKELINNE